MSEVSLTRHISSDEPRVLVVDGSRVVRQLIERVLKAELPNAVVIGCGSGEDAARQLDEGVFDLVTTSLRLPDMDGLELARRARESSTQAYIPIVVVSGDVQERLVARSLDERPADTPAARLRGDPQRDEVPVVGRRAGLLDQRDHPPRDSPVVDRQPGRRRTDPHPPVRLGEAVLTSGGRAEAVRRVVQRP